MSAQRRYGGRSTEQRRAERRERLLAAALEEFGTAGYAATTVERLCSRAGVSTRSFYEEFPGREAVLLAVHEQITVGALDAVTTAVANDAPVGERIDRAVRAYLSAVSADPRRARVAHVEVVGVSRAVEEQRRAWRRRFVELIVAEAARAADRGEIPHRDVHLGAVALIGAVNELGNHLSTDPGRVCLDAMLGELRRLTRATLGLDPET